MMLQQYLLVWKPKKKSTINHLELAISPMFFLIQLFLDKIIFDTIFTNCYHYFNKQEKETSGTECQIQLQNKHER